MKKIKIGGILAITVFTAFAAALLNIPAHVGAVGDVDPESPDAICISLSYNLRYRSRDAATDNQVSILQDFLNNQGYLRQDPTGYFGIQTLAAVKKFQSYNGLDSTGYVGPLTRAKIQVLTCGPKALPIAVVQNVPVAPTVTPTIMPVPLPDSVTRVGPTDHIKGSIDAPVKIIMYADTESPFSKRFYYTLKNITGNIDSNKVAWVFRYYPLTPVYSKDQKEADALECAATIGGNTTFWLYLDRLMAVTPSDDGLPDASLNEIASYVGIDKTAFINCQSNGSREKIYSDAAGAAAAGFKGVPSSVVISNAGNNYKIEGAQTDEQTLLIINKAMADSSLTSPGVTLTSPVSVSAKRNTELKWTWTSSKVSTVNIYLSNGTQTYAFAKDYPNAGYFSWAVGYPMTEWYTNIPNGNYTIGVCPGGTQFGPTCANFNVNIYGDTPTMSIAAPDGGEVFQAGGLIKVTFTSNHYGEKYQVNLLPYQAKEGTPTYSLGTVYVPSQEQAGNYFSVPSNVPSGRYTAEVIQLGNNGPCLNVCARAESQSFTIANGPELRLVTPNGGENLVAGQHYTIRYYLPKDKPYMVSYYLVPAGGTGVKDNTSGTYFDASAGGYAVGGSGLNYSATYVETDAIIPSDIPRGTYKVRIYLRNSGDYSSGASSLGYDDSDGTVTVNPQ